MPPLHLATVGLLVWSTVAACSADAAPDPASPATDSAGTPRRQGPPTQHQPAPDRSGAAVYRECCAACHGAQGDGRGTRPLDPPARAFATDGFRLGDTREALYRTVTHGIGGTSMPGFATTLTEAERRRVVGHVLTLGPARTAASDTEAIPIVGEQPQWLHGSFDGLAPGDPKIPRGLLVGTVDGLSWQFRGDDLRLLAVRQGAFAKRASGPDRDDAPVAPLGRVIDRIADGRPPAFASLADGSALRAELITVRRDGATAWLRYRLRTGPRVVAEVEETCGAATRRHAVGYRRVFRLRATGAEPVTLRIFLGTQAPRQRLTGSDGTVWLRLVSPTDYRVLGLRYAGGDPLTVRAGRGDTAVQVVCNRQPSELSWTTLLPPDASAAGWLELQGELR